MQPDANDIIFNEYGINILGFLQYLLRNIFHVDQLTTNGILHALSVMWEVYTILAFIASALFIFGIIYTYLRLEEYEELEEKKLELANEAWHDLHNGHKGENLRWRDVQTHVVSERPNDWKLAIIEADIMLGDALRAKGYAGNSIGDQLKSISPMQMSSLQDAWDAHLIRNRIAHEGSDFVLTQSQSREAIVKYERALKELGVV